MAHIEAQTPAPSKEPAKEEPVELINPDRPGIADGSSVIGARRFQIETAYQNEFRKAGTTTERRSFFPTLLRFGLSNFWEARIEGNTYSFARATDGEASPSSTGGLQPLSIGFKYHFQDQTEVKKHASLGTIFRLFPATGSGAFKTNHTTADLRLVADWDISTSFSLNPNLGIALYEDGTGRTFTAGLAALTLNYFNKSKTINPFLDFGLQAPEDRNGMTSLILDAGIAFIVGKDLQFDLSAGTGVSGGTPPHPFIAFGVSARFGK